MAQTYLEALKARVYGPTGKGGALSTSKGTFSPLSGTPKVSPFTVKTLPLSGNISRKVGHRAGPVRAPATKMRRLGDQVETGS